MACERRGGGGPGGGESGYSRENRAFISERGHARGAGGLGVRDPDRDSWAGRARGAGLGGRAKDSGRGVLDERGGDRCWVVILRLERRSFLQTEVRSGWVSVELGEAAA